MWVKAGRPCCGGTRFIECSLRQPANPESFAGYDYQGITVFVRVAPNKMPNQLRLEVRGRFFPQLRASWDGCAFVI